MTEDEIINDVAASFRCFGGGRGSDSNPIAIWTKDDPPTFAMGVDVREVVKFVLSRGSLPKRKKR